MLASFIRTQAGPPLYWLPAKHTPLTLPMGRRVFRDPGGGSDPGVGARFSFLSVFKWEERKAWDVLLEAYLREFSRGEGVVLYLLTK